MELVDAIGLVERLQDRHEDHRRRHQVHETADHEQEQVGDHQELGLALDHLEDSLSDCLRDLLHRQVTGQHRGCADQQQQRRRDHRALGEQPGQLVHLQVAVNDHFHEHRIHRGHRRCLGHGEHP